VADALSRPAAAVAPADTSVDFVQLAAAQKTCPDVAKLRESSMLHVENVAVRNVELLCDSSTGVLRPLVPTACRQMVFAALHQLAHAGTRATRKLISARFVWRGMASDIAAWCKDCTGCARGKVLSHFKSPVQEIAIPAARFVHMHIDIVGPFPTLAEGYSYMLTMIDRTTRWPEVVLLRSITASECADAFTSGLVARFGVPAAVTTDRGTQFLSAVWACLCRTLKIKHIMTSAFHPQSNGMIERFHRQLKEALKARQCGSAWAEHVPWVLLGLRCAPKEESGVSAAEAVYGLPLVLPNQVPAGESGPPPPAPAPQQTEPENSEPPPPRTYAEVVAGAEQRLWEADYVYVRRGQAASPFQPPYSGPFKVLRRRAKVFDIQVGPRVESISVDRLKPRCGGAPVSPAAPPCRGRPPGPGGSSSLSPSSPSLGGGHVAAE
jgi:Integrase zinc binding domain/Integrase core domain